eukprot:403369175
MDQQQQHSELHLESYQFSAPSLINNLVNNQQTIPTVVIRFPEEQPQSQPNQQPQNHLGFMNTWRENRLIKTLNLNLFFIQIALSLFNCLLIILTIDEIWTLSPSSKFAIGQTAVLLTHVILSLISLTSLIFTEKAASTLRDKLEKILGIKDSSQQTSLNSVHLQKLYRLICQTFPDEERAKEILYRFLAIYGGNLFLVLFKPIIFVIAVVIMMWQYEDNVNDPQRNPNISRDPSYLDQRMDDLRKIQYQKALKFVQQILTTWSKPIQKVKKAIQQIDIQNLENGQSDQQEQVIECAICQEKLLQIEVCDIVKDLSQSSIEQSFEQLNATDKENRVSTQRIKRQSLDSSSSKQVIQLKCNPKHVFHTDCIKQWLEQESKNNNHQTCPLCRSDLAQVFKKYKHDKEQRRQKKLEKIQNKSHLKKQLSLYDIEGQGNVKKIKQLPLYDVNDLVRLPFENNQSISIVKRKSRKNNKNPQNRQQQIQHVKRNKISQNQQNDISVESYSNSNTSTKKERIQRNCANILNVVSQFSGGGNGFSQNTAFPDNNNGFQNTNPFKTHMKKQSSFKIDYNQEQNDDEIFNRSQSQLLLQKDQKYELFISPLEGIKRDNQIGLQQKLKESLRQISEESKRDYPLNQQRNTYTKKHSIWDQEIEIQPINEYIQDSSNTQNKNANPNYLSYKKKPQQNTQNSSVNENLSSQNSQQEQEEEDSTRNYQDASSRRQLRQQSKRQSIDKQIGFSNRVQKLQQNSHKSQLEIQQDEKFDKENSGVLLISGGNLITFQQLQIQDEDIEEYKDE